MSPTLRIRPIWLLTAVLLGCDGPSGPSLGSMRLTVLGLPAGTGAAITITGPGGFSQSAQVTQTFSQLTPGTYTIAAASVTAGTAEYSPSPATQTVTVPTSGATATASVFYSQATGNLSITITGLGTGSAAAVTVTGPGYTQDVHATTTLFGLDPGSYLISARDTVAEGGTTHSPTPTSQNVTVAAGGTASASVAYSAPSSGSLNLRIAGMYITQSTQTYPATVPLVTGRNGYLRVFVIANRTTAPAEVPNVRVRFYDGGVLPVDSALIVNTQAVSVPTAVDEDSLGYTWNVPVPGSRIQPGLSIQAEVDPANTILEENETDNLFPAVGSAVADVQTVPTLRVTFVPILQATTGLQGNVTNSNKDAFLDMTRRMHPVATVDAVVSGQPFTTTRTLQADGAGWAELLSEFNAAMAADGRYYYGVVRVSYGSGVAGVAYVSQGSANAHAALGWDHLTQGSASIVAAHELAHNWGRNHAPCGGALNPDPLYPQADGSIGSYGLDVATATLKRSSVRDIMGYCDPKWIGEYSYRGVMNYRIAHPLVASSGSATAAQPAILIWGRVRDGEPILEPAFQLTTAPRLPTRPGPYAVTGFAEDGSTLFDLSFTPSPVADLPSSSEEHFVFAVPLARAKADRLSKIRLAGNGREI
ncbi:MAG TPA: hypothetical protein VHH32_12030, partial [Gemmatimonadales bacterium]|nr:hypothetical protein [Gemmatimonadales bacterium]